PRHARGLRRPVMAVPGPVTSEVSAGCHKIIREWGAVCVTSAHDVIELLTPLYEVPGYGSAAPAPTAAPAPPPPPLPAPPALTPTPAVAAAPAPAAASGPAPASGPAVPALGLGVPA